MSLTSQLQRTRSPGSPSRAPRETFGHLPRLFVVRRGCFCVASILLFGCSGDGSGASSGIGGANGGVGGSVSRGGSEVSGGAVVGGQGKGGGSIGSGNGGIGGQSGTSGGAATGGTGGNDTGTTNRSGGSSGKGGAQSGGGGVTSSNGGVGVTGGAGNFGGSVMGGAGNGGNTNGTGNFGGNTDGAGTPVAMHGKLSVSGTKLVDESGAPVQLRGPSAMWLNWELDGFAKDRATVQWMRDQWGAKIIRAAMGISPDYLTNQAVATDRLTAVVNNALDLGMYVIIDWHDHAANANQAQAIEFFSKMAQTYGSYPNVLYETFNEPTIMSWTATIKPYHEAVVAAIRKHDPDNVIVLGTGNWSQNVDEAALSPLSGSNLMYTLHFYSCTHSASLRAKGDKALAAGLPLFVTEWGATPADGGVLPSRVCLPEAKAWHDWMNKNQISWCAWKLDDCTDLSCYFKPNVNLRQTQGTWTDDMLNGHGAFVRGCMQGACP